MKKSIFVFILLFVIKTSYGQQGNISGTIQLNDQYGEYTTISIPSLSKGTTADADGRYLLENIPYGSYTLEASYIGYQTVRKTIIVDSENLTVDFVINEESLHLDEIVVTGTKTFKRKTNSPVIVSVLSSAKMESVQACNLSEGLKFQPGLRVETDCQTCNYTQLRMNGLAGGYSQILINGRPIFSPLTGLYGMEQLPTNMIDRIEVVRGGGSSLYGSSAIGGTVNVITKIPKNNSYEFGYTYNSIDGQTNDNIINGNATYVGKQKKSGITFFLTNRNRGFYDANGDNFSEIPLIKNTSIGTNFFLKPTDNQKLEVSLSKLNEYRFGGEMTDKPAHLAQQSEERQHHVWMGSADYQINFNGDRSSFISYIAWQQTDRTHYTGIIPDEGTTELQTHLENPPYGTSDVKTYNIGLQLNHKLQLLGTNVLTFGTEYTYDDVLDDIPAYMYRIDQTTKDVGLFAQSDWELSPSITLLSGVRMDKHNLVDNVVLSPRASLLYKHGTTTQFRLNYGAGFRAPQAFDTDLHIAFAGGGISRVRLSSELQPERSHSLSGSINYDKISEHYVAGFTIEGFYTRLNRSFILNPIGSDAFGELFQKENGQGATVKGITTELRANYDRKIQLEAGITVQDSRFDDPVVHIDGIDGVKDFVRTPNEYGFATLSITPTSDFSAFVNYIYTGSMLVPHFAGAPNQEVDEIITSRSFSEFSTKLSYTFSLPNVDTKFEFSAGVRNIFNAYQERFDIGKNRDSNFVYGPAQPRTFSVGLKIGAL